jgi:GNAT superfamily N-acetyltransferase
MKLSASAGWNQTREDWLRLMRLAPDGCIGIEDAGRVVASATVIVYGGRLAWIGMVLTLPEYRGQGLARRLMEHALSLCGSATVRLDASDMGKPLYERLGFTSECAVERWRRDPGPAESAVQAVELLDVDLTLDREVFGADRSALIRDLVNSGGASRGGSYALERPGAHSAYFGPCMCRSHEDAEVLAGWFVSRHAQEVSAWDLFPHHTGAVSLAERLGFRPVRRLTRMVLHPAAVALPDERVYGIAGFEFG